MFKSQFPRHQFIHTSYLPSLCFYSQASQPSFDEKWPIMRQIVLKLLKQEPVSQCEWQELFYAVHLVCMWDDKGPIRIQDCLQDDIVAFIKQAQSRVLAQREEQALLKAYIAEWGKFFTQSSYLPMPFWQLEHALVQVSSLSKRGNKRK